MHYRSSHVNNSSPGSICLRNDKTVRVQIAFVSWRTYPGTSPLVLKALLKEGIMVSIKAHKASQMGFFLAFGDFTGLSISIWEKHFPSLTSTFCYILFTFEKQTNIFMCKAVRRNWELKQKSWASRTFQSGSESPPFHSLPQFLLFADP